MKIFSQDPDGSLARIVAVDSRGWTHPPASPICTYHIGTDEPPCPNRGEYVLWGTDLHVPLATACPQHLDAIKARWQDRVPKIDVETFEAAVAAGHK
ncbi:MAG TPA: hypothetical protein VFA70_07670 [Dehalococcoidia bacterium]|nr:hypothetical protein [Dehalococcoidia bacterium]